VEVIIIIQHTDEFEGWFRELAEMDQGRIDGAIGAFEHLLEDIAEPHGARETRSRHSPNVFVLYPARADMAFVVFCVLTENAISIVCGYDANVWLDQQAQIERADDLIDQYGLVP
jgi:hypothetical protein